MTLIKKSKRIHRRDEPIRRCEPACARCTSWKTRKITLLYIGKRKICRTLKNWGGLQPRQNVYGYCFKVTHGLLLVRTSPSSNREDRKCKRAKPLITCCFGQVVRWKGWLDLLWGEKKKKNRFSDWKPVLQKDKWSSLENENRRDWKASNLKVS